MKIFNPHGRAIGAKDLYRLLIDSGIRGSVGDITVNLLGVSTKLNGKSAMGDILQEWLGEWMITNGISYGINENSQEFPDFYLNINSTHSGLLEVKTFDCSKSPNFDIANFEAYVRSLIEFPYKIHADYLIIGYTLDNIGVLKIEDIWLKNVWEISCGSERFDLKTQVKQDTIYNIRPADWRSDRHTYSIFPDRKTFISAIQKTLNAYNKTSASHLNWENEFKKAYLNHHGEQL